MNNNFFTSAKNSGFVLLYATLLIVSVTVAILVSIFALSLSHQKIARTIVESAQAYYTSEAGIEDAIYRVKNLIPYSSSYSVPLGNSSTDVLVTSDAGFVTVESSGEERGATRKVQASLKLSSTVNSTFFYGVQVDQGGIAMGNGATINGNVFSNGSINGGRTTGNATVATGVTGAATVEWPIGCTNICGDSNGQFASTGSHQDAAQSFIATQSGLLNKISVFLGKNGSPTANLTLRITADNAGKPASSQLPNASAIILQNSVGNTPSWVDVTLATPPNIVNGTKYWIVLDYSTSSAVNNWNWRKDSTDGYVNNTGKATVSWSSGGAVWNNMGGDLAFRLWIGGISNKISNSIVDGVGRAPVFVNVRAGGFLCPNVNCVVAEDPPQSLAISDGVIQDWRDDAEAGGVINGNYSVSGSESMGPKKIVGDLTVTNNAILTITGTMWVTGTLTVSNNGTIKLNPGYDTNSGVIIADYFVDISNNANLLGSGQSGSYILAVAGRNASTSTIMNISNNSTGAIYYANHGRIHFNNNAGAREVTGYGLDLDNNATVTYESGLASVHFSSGPGASFEVVSWKEIQ